MSESEKEKITEGRVGDTYLVSDQYSGTWRECKGIPVNEDEENTRKSKESNEESIKEHLIEVTRPDFRKVNKDSDVF